MEIVSTRDKRVKALVENPKLTSVKGLDALERWFLVFSKGTDRASRLCLGRNSA